MPSLLTVPVSSRNSAPAEGGSPSLRAVSTRKKWPCATSTTSPAPGCPSRGPIRASTRSARAPTSAGVSPGCPDGPGGTPSSKRNQPGRVREISSEVSPSYPP
ncbi:hypothetical protein GCM10020000_56350 [Streptomyces olivoverticillatus]